MDFKLIKEVQNCTDALDALVEEFGVELLQEVGLAPKYTVSPPDSKHSAGSNRAAEREWRANPKGLTRKDIQNKALSQGQGNPKQGDVVMDSDKKGTFHIYALGKKDSSGFFPTVDVKTDQDGPEYLDKNLKKHFFATKGPTGKMVWKKNKSA